MLKLINRYKCSEGFLEFYSHPSEVCHHEMRFGVFRPPHVSHRKVPVLYFLSGLTCNEEIFLYKSNAPRFAAEFGLMLVVPDTSPRKTGIEGEDSDWEVGIGAGFYVNATLLPWSRYFQMFDYVTKELPEIIFREFPALPNREGIFGHSMGGHGALVCALRQPGRYQSVSAFAPICAPSEVPWGKKAFSRFLGEDPTLWKQYDATALVEKATTKCPFFIDQGLDDKFLKEQLRPDLLEKACEKAEYPLRLRTHAGYDHSYYFISTFIRDHIEYHSRILNLV